MKLNRRITILAFVVVIAANSCACIQPAAPAHDPFDAVLADSFREAMKSVPCDDAKRLANVKTLFEARGLKYTHRSFERASNLEVEVAGSSADVIVVGAHYDKTALGCGAIDNWAGVLIMSELAYRFSKKQNKKTIRFVAFGGEENGLVGSEAMALEIEASKKDKPCAMLNLDSFGFDKTWGLANISDRKLLLLAADVERERGGSFSIRSYQGATSDSRSFQRIDVPAITLSGIGKNWREFLHKEKDQAVYVDFEMLAENFLFVSRFLEKLDSVSCESLVGD